MHAVGNRPMNVLGYIPKVRSIHAHIVDATVAYDELKTGQEIIITINQTFEMKNLNQHLLCLMQ